jgi:peptidoglycan/LPS O-acetylase OafA/YrhL
VPVSTDIPGLAPGRAAGEPANTPPAPGAKHIPALDGIRGIAVLLVIGLHCRELLPVNHPVLNHLAFGWSGVDLFFVLSGFLITGILLGTTESPSYFRTFYARRALRIFPLYVVYAIPAVILTGSASCWWRYATYTMNWAPAPHTRYLSHLWSLAVEEQFYLVWPAIVFLAPRRMLTPVCLLTVPAALLSRAFLPDPYRWTCGRMDALAMGGLLALVVSNPAATRRLRRLLAPVAAAALAGLEVTLQLASGKNFWVALPARTIGDLMIVILCACLVLYGATAREGLLHRMLTLRPLRTCGKYSYGMYVLQQVVLYPSAVAVFRAYGLPSPAGFIAYSVCATGGVLALAWLSWNLIEHPFLRMKDRFPYAPAPARGQQAAAA